jgi:hypothetical protein
MGNVQHINGAALHQRLAFVDAAGKEMAALEPSGAASFNWEVVARSAVAYDAGHVTVETALAKLLHAVKTMEKSVV